MLFISLFSCFIFFCFAIDHQIFIVDFSVVSFPRQWYSNTNAVCVCTLYNAHSQRISITHQNKSVFTKHHTIDNENATINLNSDDVLCFFFFFKFLRIGWIEIYFHNTLTKSLCKSLLRNGDIFTAPINMKNNPNRIDRLLSTTDELTLFWLSDPAGGGWAFCVFCGGGVIVVRLI